jgi:hypothetical protein
VERSMCCPWARWGWFKLSQSQGMNNLHTFAIKKKAQGKRRMFNLKYIIKSNMFQESWNFP